MSADLLFIAEIVICLKFIWCKNAQEGSYKRMLWEISSKQKHCLWMHFLPALKTAQVKNFNPDSATPLSPKSHLIKNINTTL